MRVKRDINTLSEILTEIAFSVNCNISIKIKDFVLDITYSLRIINYKIIWSSNLTILDSIPPRNHLQVINIIN